MPQYQLFEPRYSQLDLRFSKDVKIGDRVELTFRRLYTANGIHNYFWKARPSGGK